MLQQSPAPHSLEFRRSLCWQALSRKSLPVARELCVPGALIFFSPLQGRAFSFLYFYWEEAFFFFLFCFWSPSVCRPWLNIFPSSTGKIYIFFFFYNSSSLELFYLPLYQLYNHCSWDGEFSCPAESWSLVSLLYLKFWSVWTPDTIGWI